MEITFGIPAMAMARTGQHRDVLAAQRRRASHLSTMSLLFALAASALASLAPNPANMFNGRTAYTPPAPAAIVPAKTIPPHAIGATTNEAQPSTLTSASTAARPPVHMEANPHIVAQQIRMIQTLRNSLRHYASIAYVRDPATGLYEHNPDGSLKTQNKSIYESSGQCAGHVVAAANEALPVGVHIQPADAKDLKPNLLKAGYQIIPDSEAPQIGDIILIVPTQAMVNATPSGKVVPQHAAIWVGDQYVSDYYGQAPNGKQMNKDNAWPFLHIPKSYTIHGKPAFEVFHLRSPIFAAAAQTYAAYNGKKPLDADIRLANAGHTSHHTTTSPDIPGYQSARLTVTYRGPQPS